MSFLKHWRLALGIGLFAVIGVMANAYPGRIAFALDDMPGAKDVRSLDRRISSLEQRLYSIESSINRLEQSAISPRTPGSEPGARYQEISILRGEIQSLQLRVNEIECGLVKLDERTTTSVVRKTRRGAAARSADPCRLNPAAAFRLSTRP
jgi:hypothetical protein